MDNENYQEFQKYFDGLSDDIWRAFAVAQYNKSISEQKTHADAMQDVFCEIIALSTELLETAALETHKASPSEIAETVDVALEIVTKVNEFLKSLPSEGPIEGSDLPEIETFKKYSDAIAALDAAERDMDSALKPVMEAIRASGDKDALKELIRIMPGRR